MFKGASNKAVSTNFMGFHIKYYLLMRNITRNDTVDQI
jgi:hypothetical protein